MLKKVLAGAALLVGIWFGATVERWRHDDPDAELLKRFEKQVQINDSTSVILAAERAEKTALKGLLTAAKQLNGKLVAGVKVRLELPDVVGSTTGVKDSVRAAETMAFTFVDAGWKVKIDAAGTRDSVKIGTLTARFTVVADSAKLAWRFRVEPIQPSVGFVKHSGRYLAVVTCDVCEDVIVEAPFVDKVIKQERRFLRTVGAQYDLVSQDWVGRAGLELRLLRGLHVEAGYRQIMRSGEEPRWLVGSNYRF